MAEIKKADLGWIALSMGMGFAAFVSRGIRWNYLLETMGYRAKKSNAIAAVTGGYLANLGIPRIGEIARCTFLNQKEKIPVDKLFGTILLERTIDSLMLGICLGLTFIFQFNQIGDFFAEIFNLRKADEAEPSFTLYYVLITFVLVGLILFLARKPILRLPFFQKIKGFLLGLKEGFLSAFKMKRKGAFIFHTLLIWGLYYLMTYVCFFALDQTKHLNPADGLFVLVVGGMGMVVPSQGGIGSYHLAVKIGLMGLGYSAATGLLLATIIHAGQTLMTLFSGGIALLYLYLKKD